MLKFLYGRKHIGLIILLLASLLTTGCWDRKEIDTRGYVLGIAVDMAQGKPENPADILRAEQAAGTRKYRVSYEMKKFRSKSSSGAKPGSGEEESLVYAAEGESIFSTVRAISSQFHAGMFFEDNQVLVFSEAVARDGISDICDFLGRDPEFRRKAKLFVIPGRAETLFMLKTKSGELGSGYVSRIARNVKKAPTFASMIELGSLSERMYNKQAVAIPLLMIEGNDVKATGAALFNREYKMVGTLNERESTGAKLLRRNLKQGITVVPNPARADRIAVFELFESDIKVEPFLENDMIWFRLEAKLTGNLAENQASEQDALDPAFLAALERSLTDEFARGARIAYTALQKAKTDVVDLGVLVYQKYPKYWKSAAPRWDEEIFPVAPLKEITIKVVIRNAALTR